MSFENPKALTSDGLRTFTKWTRKDLALLRRMHARNPNAAIAKALEKTLKSVSSKAHVLGLKKSAGYLRRMGQENIEKRHRARRKA